MRITHIRLASVLCIIRKQYISDNTPENGVSDQDPHCLLTECSIKITPNSTDICCKTEMD